MQLATRLATLELTDDPAGARAARRVVRELLDVIPRPDYASDALVVTSEVVSNALQHGLGRRRLIASFEPLRGRLTVAVGDESSVLPVRMRIPSNDLGGRGLRIVELLATRWGIRFLGVTELDQNIDEPFTKWVWFELDPYPVRASRLIHHG